MSKSLIGILVTTIVCASCGDGSDDSGGSDTSSNTPEPLPTNPAADAKPRTGYLLNISGVRYNACGYQGTTDPRGAFTYDSNPRTCRTAFYIGKMQLGNEVDAIDYPIVTPYDLSNSVSQPDGSDVLTLLQSINATPNAQGVIEVPDAIDLTARDAGWSVRFGNDDFVSAATQVLAPAGIKLVDALKAMLDYAPSINCLHTGHQRGVWSGAKAVTTYVYFRSGTTYYNSVGGNAEGVVTPDGSIWLNLLEDLYYRSHDIADASQPHLDYEIVSGTLTPHLRTSIKGDIKLNLYPDNSYYVRGKLEMPSIDGWSGSLTIASPNRHLNWIFPAGDQWARFYYDVPEMRFAGRDGKHVLGLDVYADGTTRVVVADTDARKTLSYGPMSALIQSKLDGDRVSGSAVVQSSRKGDEPHTYTVDGLIDRTSMTFTVKVTVTTPSEGTQTFVEFTVDAPAQGCEQFPLLK